MGEVVSPFGPSVHIPEPDRDVVEALEELLEKARRGEVACFAYAYTTPNDTVHSGWQGSGSANIMLGAVSALQVRYAQVWLESLCVT